MKRKITFSEILSVGFVKFSAFATMGLLFLILGFILLKGFFYDNRKEYAVTSRAETSFEGATLIVNRGVPVGELPYEGVKNLFTDEYSTWKQLAREDIDVYPSVSDDIALRAAELLDGAEPGELVEYPGSAEDTVRAVADQEGGVALVETAGFDSLSPSLRERVKTVRVRPWAFAANPSVTALRDNRKIGTIDESALRRLYRGEVASWSELDGITLPVVIVLPPEGDALYAQALAAGYEPNRATGGQNPPVRFIAASSVDDYYGKLASTAGAAGIVSASRAESAGLSVIRLARQETGRNLTLDFILSAPKDSGKIGGISTIIANTFIMILLTLLFAVPPGLFAAIYLVEYAKGGTLVRLIRLGTETLAGIPSIIFGLFGLLVFVQGFGWGISLLSGSLTVTLMILPTIVRTAEEALKSVPRALQEGSLALGATKVQTIFRVVMPAAFPAIASGIILAVGRALGETAALIYTMGSNYNLTSGLLDSTRTLAVHIYLIIAEGISSDRAFASAAVLVFFILAINTTARLLVNRVGRMSRA